MEQYFVYCPDCDSTYGFTGYKTGLGKTKAQLSYMWRERTVCRNCKGMHLVDAEGNNDYRAHRPLNGRSADSTILSRFYCKARGCYHSFLLFDLKEAKCPLCSNDCTASTVIDLTTDPVNPHEVDEDEGEDEMNEENTNETPEQAPEEPKPAKKKMTYYVTIFGVQERNDAIEVPNTFNGEVITFQGKRDMDAWLNENGVLKHSQPGLAEGGFLQLPDGRALLANHGHIQKLKITVGT